MSKPVISVENLSKAYRIGVKDEIPDTLVGAMTGVLRAPFKNFNRLRKLDTFSGGSDNESAEDTLWALKDVSFDVHEGEVVGIIGRNGAGKSTLLKILSRITEPTSGRVVIRGRVSSLLEVGTGFHPELSGRDNIYMNGTILGMTKREIDRKFDEIVDFSGVEKFLDTPVKRYSSGMQVRLAFAVAAHLEPEILIIDEVLAVGDAEFQKKCLGKMKDVAKGGRTVLFVSHNMAAVRNLTSRGLFLKDGMLRFNGGTESAIDKYLFDGADTGMNLSTLDLEFYRRNPIADSPVKITNVWIEPKSSTVGRLPTISSGESFSVNFEIESEIQLSDACLSLAITRSNDQRVTTIFSKDTHFSMRLTEGVQRFQCSVDALTFSPGVYTLDCGVNKNANAVAYDVLIALPAFEVKMHEVESGKLDWANRPWGAVHWERVRWCQI